MPVRKNPQGRLGEQVIEDEELAAQLEQRESLKGVASAASKSFRKTDEEVKGHILALGVEGPVRCGQFVITVKSVEGHSIAFDTKAAVRVHIVPVK